MVVVVVVGVGVGDVMAFRQPESQKGTLAGVTGGWWPGLLLTHLISSVSFICPLLLHMQPALFWGGVFLPGVCTWGSTEGILRLFWGGGRRIVWQSC